MTAENIKNKITEIRNLIRNGRLKIAFDNIQKLTDEISDKELKNNIIISSLNFNDSFKQHLLNLDNNREIKVKAATMLLNILDDIENDLNIISLGKIEAELVPNSSKSLYLEYLPFIGEYEVQWKKMDLALHIKANIVIMQDGKAQFIVNDEFFEGTSSYKQGKLYVTFENTTEIFHFIFDAGNTLSEKMIKYLGGIILAIEGKWEILYSAYCILIKLSGEKIEQRRIDTFFKYVKSKHNLEIDKKIASILDTRIPIEHNVENKVMLKLTENPLKGKWDCIGLDKGDNIRISKLEIINNEDVVLKGVGFSNYSGKLEIEGDDLYIYLKGIRRHVTMIANLSYVDEKKISKILTSFITTNVHEKGTVAGTVYLIKETSTFYADSPIGEYSADSEIYEYYSKIDLIKDLSLNYTKNIIGTK